MKVITTSLLTPKDKLVVIEGLKNYTVADSDNVLAPSAEKMKKNVSDRS